MLVQRHAIAVTRRELAFLAAGFALAIASFVTLRALPATATASDDGTTFVPIENCRLFDTRPEFNIGPRSTPIGPDEVHRQPVTGTVGDCSIPATATGVAMNVTVVDPTAASFLTVFPYAPSPPNASNLNYLPGDPPTPNKVDVELSAAGELGFYNLAGSAHVVADATGYYTTAALDAIGARLDALELVVAGLDDLEADLAALDAEVDSEKTWSAEVFLQAKVGSGPYTVTSLGNGQYTIVFDLERFDIPGTTSAGARTAHVTATPRSDACTVSVAGASVTLTPEDTVDEIGMAVRTFGADGNYTTLCGFMLMVRLADPNPPVIFVPT